MKLPILAALLACAMLMGGCVEPTKTMTNDEIVKQVKICHDGGLSVEELLNMDGEVVKVQCVPEKKP